MCAAAGSRIYPVPFSNGPSDFSKANATGWLTLGIGGTMDAGMFVLTGHHGGLVGPAVILVFPLAGLQLLPNSLSYAEMQSPRALAQSPQPPVFYPSAQALLCYHYFSGAKPTHVYLAGIGLGSTGLYPSVICGTWLMGMSILRT